MTGVLGDLRVLELMGNQTGATVGQFLADYGADVVMVEPPGGSPLRSSAGFPFWARRKRSVELDAKHEPDRAVLWDLAVESDVLIETFRPGVADRLGVGYEAVSEANPGIVYLSVTGFGPKGPYRNVRGYEAVVQAKVGAFYQSSGMTQRPGPAFAAAPYCTASAAQVALHATLAALIERVSSLRGQHVQTSLAQALAVHDTWNWMVAHVAKQYPDAFQSVPPVDENGVPVAGILFKLMTAVSADGRWLQFSQTAQRLFAAFMRAVDLDWMFHDPDWKTVPEFEESARRKEFWELLLSRVQARTVAEWNKVFDEDPDVWAEVFRHGPEVLEHPQLIHNGSVVSVDDPERGEVRQLAPLVRIANEPEPVLGNAPRRDEHGDDLRANRAATTAPMPGGTNGTEPPLQGIVILELGTQYAAPYGATLLTDLGARVIKIEQQDGDQIRWMTPFPELSGVKALQGKESFTVDITSPEGLALVHELVGRADVVLQSFRAGVAKRRGLDAVALQAVNPNLIYVSAPAYGETGPCGHRPAYAPTIGAACGIAWRNVADNVAEGPGLSLEQIKASSMRIRAGTLGPAHPDGFSALGVATALLLGIYLRKRGLGSRHLTTSMLLTTAHAMADGIIDYADRPEVPTADHDLYGFNARYRLYEAAEGWVLLAALTEDEWAALVDVLGTESPLATDSRFSSEAGRRRHDAALAEELARVMRTRTAQEWEDSLLPLDVTCVSVAGRVAHEQMFTDEFGRASGYVTDVVHPLFGEHPRLAPLSSFSRSATRAEVACVLGQHTRSILLELGHSPEEIDRLVAEGIVTDPSR